ncbi:hypothetical protein Vretimale_16283 [Volvox reticuliferus]|uniref:5-amino-6-(5-phosphoribosylamino)uracil reductase n=1 Tax=Volvox reticuliferus TaxID=1737510 RepID=A0A8J4GSG7_9CHLO|nr:hypothetical protein Vretifemale_16920 [Volvox reticuliferus]GIM13047.1 hypothetical protein Vretimale_16283 [Volvox reticuliferus]
MIPQRNKLCQRSRDGWGLDRHVGGLRTVHKRVECKAWTARSGVSERDCAHLEYAAKLSESAAGVTQPHPNMACVLVGPDGRRIAEAFQRAQGTTSAEVQAVSAAGPAAHGATAYLNLESGDCHGEAAAVDALVRGGVSRAVVGLRHPLRHLRSRAITMLRAAGVTVDVLADELAIGRNGLTSASAAATALTGGSGSFDSDDATAAAAAAAYGAMTSCLSANEALLHRAVLRRPLGVLKYAMTLDGKIATNLGHSAWVSSPQSRALVFETRARSDAVIVGGNTVRRDNPRLTTRREGGHTPVRIVMSRTLDLPEDANLWDVTLAPTIVLTQRGARTRFQAALRSAGVEVVEFDFLTPESVADYCQERGFLQCFWECGGTLAAPTIASGVVHKVMAFVAPKIIGGVRAPTPVGELGFVEMTQAVELVDTAWSQVGPDLMITGYMPSSGGLWALEATLEAADEETAADAAAEPSVHLPAAPGKKTGAATVDAGPTVAAAAAASGSKAGPSIAAKRRRGPGSPQSRSVAFYKAWDQWGALSNFSPHPITMPVELQMPADLDGAAAATGNTSIGSNSGNFIANQAGGPPSNRAENSYGSNGVAEDRISSGASSSSSGDDGGDRNRGGGCGGGNGATVTRRWASVEHYYQAHKFSGGHHPDAAAVMEAIAAAPSPEEAARIGRRTERTRPELVRQDWATAKVAFMLAALRAKFLAHSGPRAMLLATAGISSPSLSSSLSSSVSGGSSNGVSAMAGPPPPPPGGVSASDGGVMCYELVEASPNDYYWGAGYERTGQNKLGRLLMQVRDELLEESNAVSCSAEHTWHLNDPLAAPAAASAASPASRG